MMGPPKESNLKYVPEQLPEEVPADLTVPETVEQKPPLHLVTGDEVVAYEKERERELNVADLSDYIASSTLEEITPSYLRKHKKRIVNKTSILFRDNFGEVDWREIKRRLTPEARKKFRYNRTKTSALAELNDLLTEKNPSKINARYIKQLNPNLDTFLGDNFRDAKGHIDWRFIVEHLNEELREKFEYPVRYDRNLPEKQYEDGSEVEKEISESKKYLYTFLEAKPGEEYEKRDELCNKLINLARKGNQSAERELLNYISYLIEKWSEQIPQFKVFKYHKEQALEITKRCIYNYKPRAPFVGYVYKSLESAALGLEKFKDVQFAEKK